MNIHLNSFSELPVSFIKQKFLLSLTPQQKKIVLLASIAFGFIALCVACLWRFKAAKIAGNDEEKRVVDEEQEQDVVKKDPEKNLDELLREFKNRFQPVDNPYQVVEKKEDNYQKLNQFDRPLPNGVNPFKRLPNQLLVHIFAKLDVKGWNALSRTDKHFQSLSKQPEVIASLLEEKKLNIPLNKLLELAKIAGPALRKLNLHWTSVNDQQLEDIFKACPNIEELILSNNELKDEIIEKLPQGLQKLDLSRCHTLTDAIIEKLPRGLKSLSVAYCIELTGTNFDKLPPGLQLLNLSYCDKLTDATMAVLARGLKSLNLSGCGWWLTDAGIANLPQDLQSLNLAGCHKLTNLALDQLPSKALRSLDLTNCRSMTGECIGKLPRGLQRLALFGWQISDTVITELPQGLQYLDLALSKLSDAEVAKLPRSLKTLNLTYCSELTDAGIADLPQDLQALNLGGCKRLTNAGIGKLPPGLLSLNLSACEHLTESILDNLPPNLQFLDLYGFKEEMRSRIKDLSKTKNFQINY